MSDRKTQVECLILSTLGKTDYEKLEMLAAQIVDLRDSIASERRDSHATQAELYEQINTLRVKLFEADQQLVNLAGQVQYYKTEAEWERGTMY